jgi:putative membrane-bound dehydrogenase-like protein
VKPLSILALLLFAGASVFADTPLPKAPDGFKVELVLQAPDIEAPTALAVASNGDVYFAEDPMDMSGPPTKNIDKIWLLRGGDPKKKVLFADKMWAVMGLEVVGDKLYCVHAPHVTVFTLDKDGTAAKREELFDDLGPNVAGLPGFNDHIPSGIRMGMDGWLYVSIGDKGIPKMSRIPIPLRGTDKGKEMEKLGSLETAEGRTRRTKEGHHISLEGGGVIRFRPDGTGLEVFASGTRNHLDVPMDEHDRIFVRDNTDDGLGWNTRLMYLPHGAFMGYPWAYTQRPQETLPMIHDFGGGSPCGGWVYCDDGLPETYRGRIFHCEWGQGKVYAVKVAPEGAGFKYVDQITFLDPTGTGVKDFRPFTLRPTADGRGFYVTDWGFSGWLSKTKAGRIYKVTYIKDDVKPKPRGKDTDSIEELIKGLDHPAHSERLRCQRALESRGEDAVKALKQEWNDEKLTSRAKRHAVWLLAWKTYLYGILRDKDPEFRMEGMRAHAPVENTRGSASALVESDFIRSANEDGDPRVRFQAAIAIVGSAWDSDNLQYRVEKEKDVLVRFALVKALKGCGDWMTNASSRRIANWLKQSTPGGIESSFSSFTDEYTLGAVELLDRLIKIENPQVSIRSIASLSRIYFDRKPYAGTWWGTQPAAQKPPPRNVPWEGTPKVREVILKALGDKDESVRKAAVTALAAANDPATLAPLVKRFSDEKDPATRTDLVRAVAGQNSPKTADFLTDVVLDEKNPEAMRLEAIGGLEKAAGAPASDALVKVFSTGSPTLQARAIEALGVRKAKAARPALTIALKNTEPIVRRAAVVALGKIDDPEAVPSLLPLLNDADSTVKIATIQALGALKAKGAIPQLIQAAGNEATQFDAITALAAMPDVRAVSAYLSGLSSKNADVRKASRAAVLILHDEAVPTLEQLAKRNEIPAAAIAELREVYSNFTPILNWRLIGPFPRDGKAHPPQTELKFDAAYKGAEKEVKWREIKGDVRQHGRVNLAALLSPSEQVVAYAYAEIDAPAARDATIVAGSDDTITIWLNGKKVHDHQGDRGWTANQDRINVKLEKGKNALLIQCGNSGGPWEFNVAVSAATDRYAFLKGGAQKFDLETFRTFARKNKGDAERGAKLFADVKGLACVKCHAVNGTGGQVGPDLAGIALKYKREDLMTSILEPSKTIAQGYETIVITTVRGKTLTGVFKGETGDDVKFADADGKLQTIAKKDIEERSFSPVSTMPNGLNDGMTLQDFADLVTYLEGLTSKKDP